jgi:diguanylate cyclase (GGDEF)-like protein
MPFMHRILGGRNDAEFAQRFAGALLITGAALTAGLVALFGAATTPPLIRTRQVIFPLCAFIAVSGVVFLLVPRVPRWLSYSTPSITALLICVPPAIAGRSTPAGQLLLVWPMLFAAYLLPETVTWITLAVGLAGFAVVAAHIHTRSSIALWVEMASALLLTTRVVVTLRRRVDTLTAALVVQATRDPLTGVANRREFDQVLEREINDPAPHHLPLSLLTIDTDNFKKINDRYGHPTGDIILRLLADLLSTRVRADDMIARIGGEEFAVLLTGCTTRQAKDRAEKLRLEVAASSGEWPCPVTVSIGVATFPDHAGSASSLIAASDTALYAAKASGRNAVSRAGDPPI